MSVARDLTALIEDPGLLTYRSPKRVCRRTVLSCC
jgi:hypothetical protein